MSEGIARQRGFVKGNPHRRFCERCLVSYDIRKGHTHREDAAETQGFKRFQRAQWKLMERLANGVQHVGT